MVRRLVWDQKIGGSNPPSPTLKILASEEAGVPSLNLGIPTNQRRTVLR